MQRSCTKTTSSVESGLLPGRFILAHNCINDIAGKTALIIQ